ncbi:MAG: ABC transporter ATP-binding protein [Parvularculaceae bacterium]|nr:ABC transporter ATP-binding protein [Parvularculaceae bacterium]
MSELRGSSLTLTAGDKTLVEDASFSLERGEFVALLGPNGAGKTSLIRTALGLEKKYSGEARLFGEDIKGLSPMERARRIAYLPQIRPLAWPNIVRDVVALGRYSHGAAPGRLSSLDALAVDRAIEACDLVHLAQRRTTTLSGGELGRVHCARAFAAEAPLLIADEPTAALDPRHQFRIMELIKSYVESGDGALVVLHDIQLALRYASKLIWMKDGRILASGSPAETLSVERLQSVYGVRARVEGLKVELDGAL